MQSQTVLDQQVGALGATGDYASAPVVVEVRGLSKAFRIPEHRVDSFKERAAHPFRRIEYRTLEALRDVSFDIHKGEFFGIVGRNGSGKSTLLKVLASIYGPDSGSVRVAGRLAPFIELGVGFNHELTARENSLLNGVLLGLSKKQARRRLDAILDFAELEDFVELKLKNYSSGMMVRLAFAVMVQADADVILIDEVLAVGDAAFAQKCMDVFRERRRAGKTIVLVTHDMSTVQEHCDRAMLMHDGDLKFIGDSTEAAMQYFKLNFSVDRGARGTELDALLNASVDDEAARVIDARLTDEHGQPVRNLPPGEPLRLHAVLQAQRELITPKFLVHGLTEEGTVLFEVLLELPEDHPNRLAPGQQINLTGEIENPLLPGRYVLNCWVRRDGDHSDWAVQAMRLLDFTIYGTTARHGYITLPSNLTAQPQPTTDTSQAPVARGD